MHENLLYTLFFSCFLVISSFSVEPKIRLLMTTGCMEYWLMLHYRFFTPSVQTEADKERMLSAVREKEPNYQKGNKEITARIAEHYPVAVENAEKTLENLLSQGLPGLEDTDERNRWLCEKCLTFSTVQEAINYLGSAEKALRQRKTTIYQISSIISPQDMV